MLTTIQVRKIPEAKQLFSVDYYLELHKEVFEHNYDFAGKIRDENIMKGHTPFCRPELIYGNLKNVLQQNAKNMTKIESKDDMATWLADSYGELNIIHPFREGNGRIAREYLRECVECADEHLGLNYELDFSEVNERNAKQFLNASIISAIQCDNSYLEHFFHQKLKEKKPTKDKTPVK